MEEHGNVLIMEDDPKLGQGLSIADVSHLVGDAVGKLDDMQPEKWLTLQLGAMVVGKCRTCRRSVKKLRSNRHLCVAERCYQTHAYIINSRSVDPIMDKLRKGFTASGAIASLQGEMSRGFRRGCYFIRPAVIGQQQTDSETCRVGTWNKAHGSKSTKDAPRAQTRSKPKAQPKKLRPISKRSLKGVRGRVAATGGSAKAGCGSTKKVVRRKEACLERFWRDHGVYPTRGLAHSRWGVSKSVWERVRLELGAQ